MLTDTTLRAPALDVAAAVVYAVVFTASIMLVRRRPIYGLAWLLATVPFALTRYAGHTTLTTFKFALVGVTITLAADYRRSLGAIRTAPATLVIPLLLLVLATFLSAVFATFHPPAIRETLKAGEYTLVALVAFAIGRLDRADAVFFFAVAVVMSVTVLDALHDFAVPQSGFYVGTHAVTRLAGQLEGPNQFAAFIDIALPVLVVAIRHRRSYLVAIGLGSFALMATFSRTGLITGFGALLVTAFASGVMPLVCAAAAAGIGSALAVTALSFAPALAHVFSTAEETQAHAGGVGMRSELWKAAFRMFRTHPLLGVGPGNFEFLLQRYGVIPGVRTHANSVYFEAAADGGIVLAAATIANAWLVPLRLLRCDVLARAIGIAGVALAVHGFTDDVTFYTKVGEWWWLFAGYAAAGITSPEVHSTAQAAT